MTDKICSKCGLVKPMTEFWKRKSRLDGLYSDCKECTRRYHQKWKDDHRESVRERERKRRVLNRESINRRAMQWYRDNPTQARAGIMRGSILTAAKRGVVVDSELFTVQYIKQWLESQPNCECCGNKLELSMKEGRNYHPRQPSLDRLIPTRGYVKGNVSLICWRCNAVKKDAGAIELRMIADWIDRKLVYENGQPLPW